MHALKSSCLYGLGKGFHIVSCPWIDLHPRISANGSHLTNESVLLGSTEGGVTSCNFLSRGVGIVEHVVDVLSVAGSLLVQPHTAAFPTSRG